jgi:uncharacterized membrane protein (UPF0127 family)
MFYHKVIVIAVGLGSVLLLVGLVYLLFAIPAPAATETSNATSSRTTTLMKNTLKAVNATEPNKAEVIAKWYLPLTPITLGDQSLQASVADSPRTREQGLSGTPYLPTGMVKLFVFEESATWSFWMKDMNYPIDIVWLDENKTVVHIESGVAPDSFPQSLVPTVPARYVIETTAGFTEAYHVSIGTRAAW